MIKLVKVAIAVVLSGLVVYLALTVSLGERTLYEHLLGIAETKEAKNLEKEIGKKVKNTTDGVKKELKKRASELSDVKDKIISETVKSDKDDAADKNSKHKATDEHIHEKNGPSNDDREALNQLVKKKNRKTK